MTTTTCGSGVLRQLQLALVLIIQQMAQIHSTCLSLVATCTGDKHVSFYPMSRAGTHVGHVQMQQYGFRARLIFPSNFRLFLLWASLDQSKTSTKQKTKKPSVTRHAICGNNYSLRREM